MENAGRGVADRLTLLGIGGPVAICCGKGNNAGDGFVIARHLDLRGYPVRVLLCGDPDELQGDAAVNFRIIQRSGLPIHSFGSRYDAEKWDQLLAGTSWIVDALLGTGSHGEPRPPLDAVIDQLNACGHAQAGGRPAQRVGLRHGPAGPPHDPRPAHLYLRRHEPRLSGSRPSPTRARSTWSTSAFPAGLWKRCSETLRFPSVVRQPDGDLCMGAMLAKRRSETASMSPPGHAHGKRGHSTHSS